MNTTKELKEKMKLVLNLKLTQPFRFKSHEKTSKAGLYLDLCVHCFECIQKFKECFPLVQNYEEQLCVYLLISYIYTFSVIFVPISPDVSAGVMLLSIGRDPSPC